MKDRHSPLLGILSETQLSGFPGLPHPFVVRLVGVWGPNVTWHAEWRGPGEQRRTSVQRSDQSPRVRERSTSPSHTDTLTHSLTILVFSQVPIRRQAFELSCVTSLKKVQSCSCQNCFYRIRKLFKISQKPFKILHHGNGDEDEDEENPRHSTAFDHTSESSKHLLQVETDT